jgi:hypothetical protein
MMARKDPLKGTNINDLLDISLDLISNLTRRELSMVTSRLASAANKRIANLNKRGLNWNDTERFSVKGKSVQQLRAVYKDLYQFFHQKAFNTVKSATKYEKDTRERLAKQTGVDMSDVSREDLRRFFHMFNRMEKENAFQGMNGSDITQPFLFKLFVEDKNITFEKLLEKVQSESVTEYEEQAQPMGGGTAEFFTEIDT